MAGPVKKVSVKGINVAVWSNTFEKNGQSFEKLSVSLSKNYKQGDEWKSTNNLAMEDLPYAILALQKTFADNYVKDEIEDVEL
jgi:hypothetical protein